MELEHNKCVNPPLFTDGNLTFAVPLKCGFTAFVNAAKTGAFTKLDKTSGPAIAVMRDPVSRLISFYKDKVRDNADLSLIAQKWVADGLGITTAHDLSAVTFTEFFLWFSEVPKRDWNQHVQPQHSYFLSMFDIKGIVNLDIPEHSDWLFTFLSIDRTKGDDYNRTNHDKVVVTQWQREAIHEFYRSDYDFLERNKGLVGLPEK